VTVSPVRFVDRAARDLGTDHVGAVAAAARRFTDKRARAVAEYPAMDAMRDQARAIRMSTLANLELHLGDFAAAVEAAGGSVFFAGDAAEANDYIRRLADASDAHTVVKSKSMVTEEIKLNDALETGERRVVETDLGEFVVQLRNDRPVHIITPIVHLTRHDVASLFEEALGVEYTDIPGELTRIAADHLRPMFLGADMGISGVNFGVAESGTVCLVTNEGNGRLTTTAPRIHVAVMGMERIVPTFGDLSVMLEVLARSATGQRMSAYTNLVTGPRRDGEPDGPDEFHVVILDNGRSRVLAGENAEILACIRCGACLNICPVYRSVGGHAYGSVYSGPLGAVLTPAKDGMDDWHDLPDASSLCGACAEVCPIRIDIPTMLLQLRAEAARSGHADPSLRRAVRAYAAAAIRPAAFRAMLGGIGLTGRAVRAPWLSSLPSSAGHAWTGSRDLPTPASRSFHDRWKSGRAT
jgi:L-lactate dehydrogenase complex protein LldF